MPIVYKNAKDLFSLEAEALVNPVNCVGVMGRGLAKDFKVRFPENFVAYKQACSEGLIKIGIVHCFRQNSPLRPTYIFNFPTKRHWRENSELHFIDAGLENLASQVKELSISSIAIPALGCGLGGLSWLDVKPRIENAFHNTRKVDVLVVPPI